MKSSRGPLIPIVCALAILIVPFTGLLPDYWITLFNYIGISSLVAIGLVLLTGVGGMTSFGQAAFVGFGAYTTAVLTTQFGISPWLTLPASLVVTMAVAGLIGAITVRLSGHYLPLGTIAWGIAFFYLFGNIGWLGAHDGLAGIPPLRIGTHALIDPRDYFVVVWVAVVLAVIATQNLLGGRVGRAIRALRRSTRAAEAFGVNTAAAKLMVFVYAAMLAGLAGWLYAHFQRSVSPGPFGVTAGTEYLLMAVLGRRRPGVRRHSGRRRNHISARPVAEFPALADRQYRQLRNHRLRRRAGADPANRVERRVADPVRTAAGPDATRAAR